MIIDQKKTTLAYRCPACGGVPTSMVGAFSLSGSLFKLKCSCKKSEVTVEKLPEDKIRLTVPCLACPSPHIYTLSKSVFFGSDVFVIPCSLCGIDICFLGKEDKVSEAVVYSNNQILASLGEEPAPKLDGLKSGKKKDLSDPQINEIVTYVISELNEEGKIYCKCPDHEGEYECTIYDDYIMVKCKKCKASATVPNDSTIAAYNFLNADSLTLT